MSNTKSEKIKKYIVISLSIFLLISVYYRFIHSRVSLNKVASMPLLAVEKKIQVPLITRDNSPVFNNTENQVEKYLNNTIRDVFIPALAMSKKKDLPESSSIATLQKVPAFNLRGIIKGKNNAVAIIDDRFLKENDYLDNYRVKEINEKDVVIEQGGKTIRLELFKK